MNSYIYYIKKLPQRIIDSIYFWSFWIITIGILVGIIERNTVEIFRIIIAVIIPHILPVYISGLLFDYLFIRKKIILFLITTIPLCYLSGLLINLWFYKVLNGINIQIKNEILVFVFAAMYIGFRYIRVAIAQKNILREVENKNVIAELQFLKSQLNPHFLFNALNSIYSLILSGSDKAGEATLLLSELMRFHIDLSGKQNIPLSAEINMIERYISLEKLRLDNRCKIHFSINGNTDTIQIAPLIFIPFIENAFKHGITSVQHKNIIQVMIAVYQDKIELEVNNSIPEKYYMENNPEIKIGIDNTIKRLELHYKDQYQLFTGIKEGQYKVTLTIKRK